MAQTCLYCNQEQRRENALYCDYCGKEMTGQAPVDYAAKRAEEEALNQEFLEKSSKLHISTAQVSVLDNKIEILGLVFGTSSKQAFWGLSTQSDRLERAYSAALSNLKYDAVAMNADGVLGIQFALNNSTGSGNQLLTGSSEAVMLLGTAFRYKK